MTTEFTPLTSLAGGMLIGLAAVLLMAANGRIAGISGILSRLLPPGIDDRRSVLQGAAIVLGLLAAAPIYAAIAGQVQQTITMGIWPLVLAGLLVGFGAALGSGCTSGHGVCGISRLSARSIVATVTFMFTAAVTVFVLRHVIGA